MTDDLKENEWWWIDYLEDEFDPSLNQDLEKLLGCSQEDRDVFESFRALRQWLRRSDPASSLLELNEIKTAGPSMRDKVMNELSKNAKADGEVTATSTSAAL